MDPFKNDTYLMLLMESTKKIKLTENTGNVSLYGRYGLININFLSKSDKKLILTLDNIECYMYPGETVIPYKIGTHLFNYHKCEMYDINDAEKTLIDLLT